MIIASNFKTNHTRKSTKEFLTTLNSFIKEHNIKDEILVFPTATSFDNFNLVSNISVGTQNAYHVRDGSFTGEIGTKQLDEFNIKTILIGHSERRHVLKESNESIEKKYNFYKNLGYKIVFCIGEPLEVREAGPEEVLAYNFAQLENIDINYENLIIAYEPVWAIGTGLTASVEQINETLNELRHTIKAPLLYGGSVKVTNTKEILEIPNCDGILVGTASWKVEDFSQMCRIASEL